MSVDIDWYRDACFFEDHPELVESKEFQEYLEKDGDRLQILFGDIETDAIYWSSWSNYDEDLKNLSKAFPGILFTIKCVNNCGNTEISFCYARDGQFVELMEEYKYTKRPDWIVDPGDFRDTTILFHTVRYRSRETPDAPLDDMARLQIKNRLFLEDQKKGMAFGKDNRFEWELCL